MSEKISVIIPFYNRISLVLESVKSVVNQTYQNYEIILIDDGSTEDIALLKEFIENDERIQMIQQSNSGVAAARNTGIAAANGEYIAFLDSDDLFKTDKLEKQLQFMKEKDAVISYTSYDRISMDGSYLETIPSGMDSGKLFSRFIYNCAVATPTVMIKSDIIKDMDSPFNTAFHIGEDVCLWLDLSYHHEFLGIEEPLTQVRVGEMSAALNLDKRRVGLLNIINHLIRTPEYVVYEKEIALLIDSLKNCFVRVEEREDESDSDSEERKDTRNSFLFLAFIKGMVKDGFGVAIKKTVRKIQKHFVS